MTQGFGVSLFLLGAGLVCGCGDGYRARAGPGFRCVLFCLQIKMKIKILNSIKTKVPLSHLLYSVGSIPTQDPDSRTKSIQYKTT